MPDERETCGRCEGVGVIVDQISGFRSGEDPLCRDCNGSGRVEQAHADWCMGGERGPCNCGVEQARESEETSDGE